MLEAFLSWFSKRCLNIKFTSLIKTLPKSMQIHAKHQLYYWHVRYVEEQLAEDKPPAYYDPRKAHLVFSFIDSMWALGITRGDIKEYFDGWDVEAGANVKGGVREHLQQMQKNECLHWSCNEQKADLPSKTQIPSTLSPLVIIKAGDYHLPIWQNCLQGVR
jgi:hypothetical protein